MVIEKRRIDGNRLLMGGTTYLDRRGAVIWPSPKAPGCILIMGLVERQTGHGEYPLVMIYEDQKRTIPDMVAAMSARKKRYACNLWFGNMSKSSTAVSFRKHIAKTKSKLLMFDSSEFPVPAEEFEVIAEKFSAGLIDKPHESTQLFRDGRLMDSEAGRAVEPERIPSFACLSQIVFSYELYPYTRRELRSKRVERKNSREGYA